MDDDTDTDICLAILLALEWINDIHDLVSVSLTNKTLLSVVPQAGHLWKPFREAISGSFALHDHIDTSNWDVPNVPPCGCSNFNAHRIPRRYHLGDLKIPPRCHAGPRDSGPCRGYYHPHPRDRDARRHPQNLVLDPKFLHHINEQGQLEDRFHVANADPDNWMQIFITVWIPRTFPCECQYCPRTVLQDQKSLIQHCLTYNHQDNAKKDDTLGFQYDMASNRVPLEFVDPRHDPSYSSLDEFQKVRRLIQYRTKVLNALRAPMNDEELANMNRLLTVINVEAGVGDDSDRAFLELPRPAALECVIGACIDESVESFRRDGMAFGCLDVILNGRADYFGWVASQDGYEWGEDWENFFNKVVSWGERNVS
jgi:hypothetical protein